MLTSTPKPTPTLRLHQIAFSPESRAQIAPGWMVLDNLANPRPDWYEYWPIREYLQAGLRNGSLDETAFYGFFSPKFSAKTNLSLQQVQSFVARHADQADVLLFSPQPDMGAFFLNVFEQGEAFDPGLIDCFSAFLHHIGRPAPLRTLVMDSRQVVFSNYFVARPAFWREWLQVNEALFAICEGLDTSAAPALHAELTKPTTYATGASPAQRKVFLQERVASLLLATQPQWRSVAHDPFGMGWSLSRFRQHPTEAFISDALKLAWRVQPYPEYLQAFATLRDRFSKGQLPVAGA